MNDRGCLGEHKFAVPLRAADVPPEPDGRRYVVASEPGPPNQNV